MTLHQSESFFSGILKRLFFWRKFSVAWFLLDFCAAAGAVFVAYRQKSLPIDIETLSPLPWHSGAIPVALLYGSLIGVLYYFIGGRARTWQRYRWSQILIVSLSCITLASIALILILYFLLLQQVGRGVVTSITALTFLLTFLLRIIIHSRSIENRVLLLITDEDHQPSPQMAQLLADQYEVVEFDRSILSKSSTNELLEEWLAIGVQDIIFVSRCEKSQSENLLVECWKKGIRFVEWNYFLETNFQKLNVYDDHLDWLMQFDLQYAHPAYSKLKRATDILFASLGIILSLPLLLLGCLAVKLTSKGPVIFKQERVGVRGKVFMLWKLRTMELNQSDDDSKFSEGWGDKRLTKPGGLLRKLRIDELPQFFHILRGDMSLVGPRPEWVEVADRWQDEIPIYSYRTMVKPGLTGWAQINFPYAATKQEVLEKLSYDFYYIKHASLKLDIQTILRTIAAMFQGGR